MTTLGPLPLLPSAGPHGALGKDSDGEASLENRRDQVGGERAAVREQPDAEGRTKIQAMQ